MRANELEGRLQEVSSNMLVDFMQRVKEWGGQTFPPPPSPHPDAKLSCFPHSTGNNAASAETVRSLVRENVPEGPAREPLQIAALKWVEAHPAAAIGIGLAVCAPASNCSLQLIPKSHLHHLCCVPYYSCKPPSPLDKECLVQETYTTHLVSPVNQQKLTVSFPT